VHDVAAGCGVPAQPHRLVAHDRFLARELQVGGELGREAVEPARVEQVLHARCRSHRGRRQHARDDGGFNQRQATLSRV